MLQASLQQRHQQKAAIKENNIKEDNTFIESSSLNFEDIFDDMDFDTTQISFSKPNPDQDKYNRANNELMQFSLLADKAKFTRARERYDKTKALRFDGELKEFCKLPLGDKFLVYENAKTYCDLKGKYATSFLNFIKERLYWPDILDEIKMQDSKSTIKNKNLEVTPSDRLDEI